MIGDKRFYSNSIGAEGVAGGGMPTVSGEATRDEGFWGYWLYEASTESVGSFAPLIRQGENVTRRGAGFALEAHTSWESKLQGTQGVDA